MTTENIVNAFLNGQIHGLENVRPEHIKTQISHLFLYPDKVYKLYRRDNSGFNSYFVDLADEKIREDFYKEDFFTNHYFNQEVYLRLLRIKQVGESFIMVFAEEEGSDLIIEMKRIDPTRNLMEVLKNNALSPSEAEAMGYFMTRAIAEFPEKPSTEQNYHGIMVEFMDDLRGFSYMADPHISKDNTDKVMVVLTSYVLAMKEAHQKIRSENMVISIDNHADNIFYQDGRTSFIDVYLPKASWRIVEPLYCIYRPATDVAVWEGQNPKESMVKGYMRYYGLGAIEQSSDLFYQIYFALIRAAGFYQVYKEHGVNKEIADKYWEFIETVLPKLEASL